MSYASDALLKETAAKVAALEKMVLALKDRVDALATTSQTLRVPKRLQETERTI